MSIGTPDWNAQDAPPRLKLWQEMLDPGVPWLSRAYFTAARKVGAVSGLSGEDINRGLGGEHLE